MPDPIKGIKNVSRKLPAKKTTKNVKDISTRNYSAATGLTKKQDPTYNYKKAAIYEKNAIEKYGSLKASRKAYSSTNFRSKDEAVAKKMFNK